MSLSTEINRIETAKADIKAAIEEKGVTVPDTTKIDGMAALISSITTGGGGASGGGAQAARGVITLADNILTPNTLIANITGLGFSPKYVLIVGRATKYTLINTSISGKYRRVIYLCEHDGTTNYSGYVYQQYISATNTDGTYGKIVLNSDGFSFYTGTNSESAAYASFEYHYVAIG